jgi:Skp family chaperone for outer membrane proteins
VSTEIDKLRTEIETLEKQLDSRHFSGLFDRKRQEQHLKKLKKLRKQLKEMEKAG